MVPHPLLGRANASMEFLVHGCAPAGALAGGALGSAFGVRPTLWIAWAGMVAASLWLFCSPVRRVREAPGVENG